MTMVCAFVLLSGAALSRHLGELEASSQRGGSDAGSLSKATAQQLPHAEAGPPHREWRVGAGQMSARLSVQPGRAPSLLSLQWGGWRDAPVEAASAQGPGWEMDVGAAEPLSISMGGSGAETAGEPKPCKISATDMSRAELDCGGLAATLHVTAHEAGPRGAVLRWHLAMGEAAKLLRLTMWLPGAAVEGVVDGSPVTARRRPRVA